MFAPSRTAIATKYKPAKMRSARATRGRARANRPSLTRRFQQTIAIAMRITICAGSSR
jgi:hypothetical protein